MKKLRIILARWLLRGLRFNNDFAVEDIIMAEENRIRIERLEKKFK